MDPRSGLTYIVVNRRTRLVLDDPIEEGGSVHVAHLNENETQKWMLSQSRDGLWTLQNVGNGGFLCIKSLHTNDGDPVVAKHGDDEACRWFIIPEDSMSFRICTSNPNCAASLDTSIGPNSMPVVLKDSLSDPARGWTFMRTVEIF
ncbi:hypothetical protein BJ322DRAFT_243914 [Thelephora terrestris]|uniref:Ricin B lectin domain-containing protein n=1 Tax=Thelephora terrestris TaxID=56493 RepID=A0A9P6H995_9AGAM|nr:hypothetical protein BJ322DRAFT_243914 [Thelephora terrestris]